MTFGLSTDIVLDGIRSTIGSSVITVDGVTVALRRKPEVDLWALPEITGDNYPLVALEVVSEDPGVMQGKESVQVISMGAVVAMHVVARLVDVTSAGVASPQEYIRKASQAVAAKIAATPNLSTSIVGGATWQGGGQEIASKEALREQGLVAHGHVWQFDYGTGRL
jgi:hypothetical protein